MDVKEEEIIAVRRQYVNAWRAAHKDRVREYNRRFWRKKAEQMVAQREVKKNGKNSAENADA